MKEYKWKLKDAKFTKDKGKVFSCFSCCGGSTMGYKLAGFDVIGCNEIDPKMMDIYKENHTPKYSFLEGIQTFKDKEELPKELYELDILDGSPPCSSFSLVGNREKDWGKEKKFREGQSEQVLDTLFFDFIDLAERLQPKVVIAENVKGILMGDAKKYCAEIYKAFDKAGYYLDKWLLNSSKMGVPQKRERVFFIAIRKDLSNKLPSGMDLFNNMPELNLMFNKKLITFKEIDEGEKGKRKIITGKYVLSLIKNKTSSGVWQTHKKSIGGKLGGVGFGNSVVLEKTPLTVISGGCVAYYDDKNYISNNEMCMIGTFPIDYNFGKNKVQYIIGMSVPPIMIKNIALEIYNQWLSKL